MTWFAGALAPYLTGNLISESQVPGCGPGSWKRDTGRWSLRSWKRDTGRRPGSSSGQLNRSPYRNLTSESPGPGYGPLGMAAAQARNETPDAGQAPARASLAALLDESSSQLNIRVARPGVRPGAAAAGNEIRTPDAGRLGSGSDQLRPDSEARRGNSEPGKRGLGCRPVTPGPGHSGEPAGRAHGHGSAAHWQASGQHCRGPDRIAAHCEAEQTGVTAARRIAGRLSPAGLRLATSTTLTAAVRSGRRSRLSRACRARNGATSSRFHGLD